jgi:hypothetical protein
MNKKLFSWKALAGLALLVAMGLTSCKNNTEVDPNDPYNVTKPSVPTAKGTTLSGFKTVTELNNLIAGTKDITDNIGAGKTVTITANCANLEVTPTDYKVVIPGATDATINLELTGAFKTKDGAILEISDQALDVLNLNLVEADYSFNTPYSTVTLNSAIKKAKIAASTNNLTPFTVAAGGSIAYLDYVSGNVLVNGGSISGAVTNKDLRGSSTPLYSTKDGLAVANVKGADGKVYYMKNLRIEKGAAQIKAYAYFWDSDNNVPIYALNKVTVAADAEVYLDINATELTGEGGEKGAKVSGYLNEISGKISDVTITSAESNTFNANLDNVTIKKLTRKDSEGNTFTMTPYLKGTASKVVFEDDVNVFIYGIKTSNSFAYTFDGCEFADGARIYASWNDAIISNPLLDENGNQKTEIVYYYWYWGTDSEGNTVRIYSAEKSSLSAFTDAERKDPNNTFVREERKLYTTPTAAYDKDFVATLNLKGCKYAGAAYTKDSTPNLMSSFSKPGESEWSKNNGSFYANVKYQIDGVGYKLVKVYKEGSSTSWKTIWEKE